MKGVSAAIMTLAGVFLFTLGADLNRGLDDFAVIAGGVAMLFGFVVWIGAMLEK